MTYQQHPGQEDYPDLKNRLKVKGLGEHESPEINVEGGLVRFSRWDEDIDDRVSFVITEWELGLFVDKWVKERLQQRWPLKKEMDD